MRYPHSLVLFRVLRLRKFSMELAFVNAAETPDFAQGLPLDKTLAVMRDAETNTARTNAQSRASVWAVMMHPCPKSEATSVLYCLLS